tara:strand:- start:1810 stop:3045 length:1236 start_codon:yes stop_codon:yes gene_type:complete
MAFLILLLIYLILYYIFFSNNNFSRKSFKSPFLTIFIFSIVFLIISIIFGLINNNFANWEDIENYKEWMKRINLGENIGKDPSFSILLNLFNTFFIGYDFTIKILLPLLIILIYLISLVMMLPQYSLAIISGFFLILPAQIVQESIFSSMRFGLATSLSFLSLGLIINFVRCNPNLKNLVINKTNIQKLSLIIIFVSLSITTHIGSIIFFFLIIISALIDFIFNLFITNFKKIPFFIKFSFVHLIAFLSIFYVFNISQIDISFLMNLPGFYRIQNYIVKTPLSEIILNLHIPPVHRSLVYISVFSYFYFINSFVRFKYPTNLNKFVNILSICSIINLILVFSPISLIYPIVIRISIYALIALAFTSSTIGYRLSHINKYSIIKNYYQMIKVPSFILINLFSLYCLISFINN